MYEPKVADRVLIVREGKMVKGRVAVAIPHLGRVGVTCAKGEQPTVFLLSDVFPLYRYTKVEAPGIVKALTGADEVEMIEPLFVP